MMTKILLLLTVLGTAAWGQTKTFSSPMEGAKALIEAAKQPTLQPLLAIFGDDAKDLFPEGDGDSLRKAFVEAAAQGVAIDEDPTNLGAAIIDVGELAWPFPIPLVRKGDTWQFDLEAGRREITARRLGADELDALRVCLGYVEAQKEYARVDRNGDGMLEFAQRILSTPGQKDGLFWEGADSPAAGSVTKAVADGYRTGKLDAFRGYHFRVLKAQGPDAPGGARNYVVNKKWMMGGFALVAWPAQYGVTGVRTFLVNHDGVVYEKDLGPSTATAVTAITRFNPDKTWLPAIFVDIDD